jgi:hypothetical protein
MPADDAYIHFTIARNFVNDGAPYFDLQTPAFASTSPFWTLLVSLFFYLFGASLAPVIFLNALVMSTFLILLFWFLQKELNCSPWLSAVTVFVVSQPLIPVALSLMETPLALLWMILVVLNPIRQQIRFAFLLLSVLPFIRPEGIVFVVMYVGLLYGRHPKRVSVAFPYLICLPIVFLLFELYYYGTVIPSSILAKQIIHSWDPLIILSTFMGRIYTDFFFFSESPAILIQVFSLVFPAGVICAFINLVRDGKIRFSQLCILFGLTIFSAFLYKRVCPFSWYVPLFLTPLQIGIILVTRHVEKFAGTVLLVGLFLPALLSSYLIFISMEEGKFSYPHAREWARTIRYLEIGEELNVLPEVQKLLTPEIGALGWSFRKSIDDAGGIATPWALQCYEQTRRRSEILRCLLDKSQPDAILFTEFDEGHLRGLAPSYGFRCLYKYPALPASFPTSNYPVMKILERISLVIFTKESVCRKDAETL